MIWIISSEIVIVVTVGVFVTHGWWNPKIIYAPLRSSKICVLEMAGCTSKMSLPFLHNREKSGSLLCCVTIVVVVGEIGEASKV